MKSKFKIIDTSKVNDNLDVVIKSSTFLFFIFNCIGFLLLVVYLNKYGLAYEAISYISSLNYLFSLAFIAVITSVSLSLCLTFFPYWIDKLNKLESVKWLDNINLKGKNKEIYDMIFLCVINFIRYLNFIFYFKCKLCLLKLSFIFYNSILLYLYI